MQAQNLSSADGSNLNALLRVVHEYEDEDDGEFIKVLDIHVFGETKDEFASASGLMHAEQTGRWPNAPLCKKNGSGGVPEMSGQREPAEALQQLTFGTLFNQSLDNVDSFDDGTCIAMQDVVGHSTAALSFFYWCMQVGCWYCYCCSPIVLLFVVVVVAVYSCNL